METSTTNPTISLTPIQVQSSAVHGFWSVEFPNGRLGANHYCSDMFGLVASLRLPYVNSS